RRYNSPSSKGVKYYFQSVLAARLIKAWGLGGRSHEKKIPDWLFGASEELQWAFLEGYFLGDGTASRQYLSMTTNSAELKDGLLYLFGQLGVIPGHTYHEPATKPGAPIMTRRPFFTIWVTGKGQLERCKPIWERHANAGLLRAFLRRPMRKKMAF